MPKWPRKGVASGWIGWLPSGAGGVLLATLSFLLARQTFLWPQLKM